MESDLAQTRARLEEALERVESVDQAVTVDLPHVTEASFLCLSLTPWSLASCFSALASCPAGLGDVKLQVTFPLGGARSDGVGGYGVMVGRQARVLVGVRPP